MPNQLVQTIIGGTLLLKLTTLVVLVSPRSTHAQTPPSPTDVLRAFRRADSHGERLTKSGWYRSNELFIKPALPPPQYVLGIMYGEDIYNSRVDGNRAEVTLRRSAVGQLDASFRFTSVVAPELIGSDGTSSGKSGQPEIHGLTAIDVIYELVFTDDYWEFDSRRRELRNVKGPRRWRLKYFEPEPWVTADVAIEFLTQMREQSSGDAIKSNIERSLRILRARK